MLTENSRSLEIFQELDRYTTEAERLHWQGTFAEYVEKVIQNPQIVCTAHKTIFQAITTRPDFFETGQNALFGLEKTTKQLIEVLNAASQGLEPKKRILLLMGPVGGGKSTLVSALKRGLEQYSRTEQGAIYAIADCPMHEEALHLFPNEVHATLEKKYGIRIEGELCPHCAHKYGSLKRKELEEVPVRRILLSEKGRIGIGTFAPSDPKSQDITELVGSVDISRLGEYGTASDPRAYRFDGELNVANRGLVEFIEMLKVDEKFLYSLLSLAQEQVIKTGRFANISADEVIIAHTNETEYQKFVTKKENEALQDRIIVIPVPYNLQLSSEVKIYQKLIEQSDTMKSTKMHLSPRTLELASVFAILSRLVDSKKPNMTRIKKLKVYDNQSVDGVTKQEVKELKEEFPREGMEGISPRYVIDCLSNALIRQQDGGKNCLTPIEALRALRDGLDLHPHTRDLEAGKKEAIKNLITETRQEFDEIAKKEIQSAFVYAFEESAQTLLNNYLDNVEAAVNKSKVKDPVTDEEVDPDEKLMRSLEEQIGISETAKLEFRNEILVRVASLARKGDKFEYKSHPRLKEAVEKKLFNDLRDVVKITTSTKTPDKDQLEKINEVASRLISDGYCSHCANELIKYVGTLLNR